MASLVNRNEIRRLQKAAREANTKHLREWMEAYENRLCEMYRQDYNKAYEEEVQLAIENFITAIAYTLHFSEETDFNKEKMLSFMDDLMTTVDLFKTGEYKPQDYKDELAKDGIIIQEYNYWKEFKHKQEKLDELIKEYEQKLKELDNNSEITH